MFLAIKSELPKWKILLNWVCGVEMVENQEMAEEQINQMQKINFVKKSPEETAQEAADLLKVLIETEKIFEIFTFIIIVYFYQL